MNVLAVLTVSLLFGIAGSCDEWKHARWPFLAGMVVFFVLMFVALVKAGGI